MRSRGAAPPEPPGNLVELGLEDEWLEAVTYVEVGPEGERIDKAQYVSEWQEAVRSRAAEDPLLRKVRDGERLSPGEEDTLARRLNRPEHYFNEENLRRAYREPGGTLIDFIRVALGRLRIKSREEKIEETFRAWLVSPSLTADQATYVSLLKNRSIATGRVRLDDLFEPPLSILNFAVLKPGSDGPRCWWTPFDDVAESDYNLAASRYKPRIAEAVPNEDPAELIRDVLAIEREIAEGLEKLLGEVEQ